MIDRVLARMLRLRWVVLAIYAVLVPIAAVLAMHIPSRGAIDELIVPSDPDFVATRAFQQIFPEAQIVSVAVELDDPWSAASLAQVARIQKAIAAVPHVSTFTAVDALRRARPTATPDELRRLATGTTVFRKQGLAGDHFLTIDADLTVHSPAERDAALAGIRRAIAATATAPASARVPGGVEAVRGSRPRMGAHVVGAPVVASWLERQSSAATGRSFAIFGVLLVAITWFLYRSARALAAIVLALGAAVALGLGAGALLGFAFTIVSALVPLTIMVTTLASLTYLHSRYIDLGPDETHVTALHNKLRPVTASTIAAALGFGALAVSHIRPVREMGVWTALGLVIGWLVAYTLFPALQVVLHTPTRHHVAARTKLYDRLARAIPGGTYRFRYALVAAALVVCAAGAIALFGFPGVVSPMPISIDSLSNIDPHAAEYRDLVWFRRNVMDLNIARAWVRLPGPNATDPAVLQAIDRFDTALEQMPNVTGVTGPTTPLRMRSYLAGNGEVLPADPNAFAAATGDYEELLMSSPDLRSFVDANTLANLQLVVLFRDGNAAGYGALSKQIAAAWNSARAASPALAGAELRVVGKSLLQVKVGASLVPTLAESFGLTVVLILVVFLIVFRSGLERLLAMIPSLFALLATFLGLRLFGGTLNVATIIIATTVLGTTENDQLHFFHHMHELPSGAALEDRLAHALRVSGRAVVFATIINAAGFLGLSATHFPPLRQFGLMTAAAFALALVADLSALPAGLWLAARQRPRSP